MNIILCGFMGSGKTTVADFLGTLTGKKVIDTDKYIENMENRTISEIFSLNGESFFRALETKAAFEISKLDNLIVATGGGMVLNPKNIEILKTSGKIVFLNVTVETILERLKNDTTRPLLQRQDKEKAVAELLASRLPLYNSSADIIVDGNGNADDIAKEILLNI